VVKMENLKIDETSYKEIEKELNKKSKKYYIFGTLGIGLLVMIILFSLTILTVVIVT